MDEYLIGSGALLTAGQQPSIARATLHAQTTSQLAVCVKVAVIDFEAAELDALSRVLIVAAGWDRRRFEEGVISQLVARGECSLGGVMEVLAGAAGTHEVHLFARWLPDGAMAAEVAAANIRLITHPLESLTQMALVSGQRVSRWQPIFQAA